MPVSMHQGSKFVELRFDEISTTHKALYIGRKYKTGLERLDCKLVQIGVVDYTRGAKSYRFNLSLSPCELRVLIGLSDIDLMGTCL
jgi:hypothetical protein